MFILNRKFCKLSRTIKNFNFSRFFAASHGPLTLSIPSSMLELVLMY